MFVHQNGVQLVGGYCTSDSFNSFHILSSYSAAMCG